MSRSQEVDLVFSLFSFFYFYLSLYVLFIEPRVRVDDLIDHEM